MPVERARVPGRPGRLRAALGMQAQFSSRMYGLVAVAAFALLLFAWILATHFALTEPIFLPSPGGMLTRLWQLGEDGTLLGDVGSSLYRIAVGFLCASFAALVVGVLIGTYRFWEAAIEPVLDFVRYMPVVAFVPLTILWVGTGDSQKFLIIWIGTFFQQALMFKDDIKRVPSEYVALGRTLGMRELQVLIRIVLPSALPSLWDTLRVSLGWAWTWVVLAELVAADSGIGYRITVAQRYFQTDTVFGYILVLGVLGLVTDQTLRALGRSFFSYAERSR